MTRWFLLCLVLFATISPSAEAQRRPVSMQLESLSIRGRSGGAIPVRVKLEHHQRQLLEGDLLLTIYGSEQREDDILASLRYEGIVLQGTDYFLNLLLPPVAHSWNQQYLITAWFETKDGDRISLSLDEDNPNEPTELLTPSPMERTTLVCSCSGQVDYQRPSANLRFLNSRLSLNNYNPTAGRTTNNVQTAGANGATIRYYAAAWDALELPENPLNLTSFDIVVLADRALGRLEMSQLEALKVWLQAGGSLCVVPDNQPVKSIHESFLKALFESSTDPGFRVSRNDEGQIEVLSDSPDSPVHRRFGLGAVSLLPGSNKLSEVLTDKDLGELVAHLWKLRHNSPVRDGLPFSGEDLVAQLRASGYQVYRNNNQWFVRGGSQYGDFVNQSFQSLEEIAGIYGATRDFGPEQNVVASAAGEALMPSDVQMVPTWIIAVLLLCYVVAIGPFDYWFLGLFKARKFTWILFPITTLIFTALTISIAHSYMASTETGGTLSIVDVVEDGQLVRETTLQMNFFGATTTLKKDFKQAFYVPTAMMDVQFQGFRNQSLPTGRIKAVNLSGRFPQNYTSQVGLSQWDPFVSRTFQLQPEVKDVPEIDWNDASLVTTIAGRERLKNRLNLLIESDETRAVDGIVFHQNQFYRVTSKRPAHVFDSSAIQRWQNPEGINPYGLRTMQERSLGFGVIEASTARIGNNFFSVVAQVSPQGDATLEDLPVIDLTDPSQWLLMIAVKEDNQTRVFRRVFHVENPQSDQTLNASPP